MLKSTATTTKHSIIDSRLDVKLHTKPVDDLITSSVLYKKNSDLNKLKSDLNISNSTEQEGER